MSRATRIHERLEEEGIPIDGVSDDGDANVRIDFKPGVTPEQIRRANEIASQIGEREPRSRDEIRESIERIPLLKKQQFMNWILIELAIDRIQEDPMFAEKAGFGFTGDKPK